MSEPRRSPAQGREAAVERRARRAEVSDPDVVMDAAAAYLGVRPRSVAETRRRLRHLGYPPALSDEVVDRLVELGYLDDRAFARAWLESRDRARPRGQLALRQELQRKGVARDVIDEALAERAVTGPAGGLVATARSGPPDVDPGLEAGGVEMAAARRLLERRDATLAREADPRRRRQKAYALLARHGFSPDVCREAALSDPDDHGDDVEAGV